MWLKGPDCRLLLGLSFRDRCGFNALGFLDSNIIIEYEVKCIYTNRTDHSSPKQKQFFFLKNKAVRFNMT